MTFVKVDSAVLDSSIWFQRDQRSVFLTALFMAKPFELRESTPQIEVRSLKETGWRVPPGWYGLVEAAGSGIVAKDGCAREIGLKALEALGAADPESRSPAYDGRRLVRVAGGYLVLNYFTYRDRDYGAADRMRRMRERRKGAVPEPALALGETTSLDPGKAVVQFWNTMAERIGAAKVTSVKGKRASALGARLHEKGWLDTAAAAIAYLGTDDWYTKNPDAVRFDVLLRPGKAEEYVERSKVTRSAGGGRSRSTTRGAVDDAAARELEQNPHAGRRNGTDNGHEDVFELQSRV